MVRPFSDTDAKMEAFHVGLLRQATPARKMRMLGELNAAARLLALRGLQSRYPTANPTQLRRRLADLLLGPDTARAVYGDIADAA